MIAVLLVDDEPLIRQGIRMILEAEPDLEVIGEAGDGAEAVEIAGRTRPEVVMMDVRMPRVDGLRATELLLRKDDPPAVLVLTTFGHDDYVEAALRAGASGFLLKRSTADQVINAVRTVADGQSLVFPDQIRSLLAARAVVTWRGPRLTDR